MRILGQSSGVRVMDQGLEFRGWGYDPLSSGVMVMDQDDAEE
jgi:hypothetical protein